MKAKIGIIICGLDDHKQYVSDAYIQAIKSVGGVPLILPLVKSKSIIEDYVKLCDGFLFCGGGDITPLLFGQEPMTDVGKTDITLDLFQIRVMKTVLEKDKPILAICRGMQVLNVACGGSIYQDLSLTSFETINHMQPSITRKDVSHKVIMEPGTRLHRIMGIFEFTNSFHHQSIHCLGKDLVVSAFTKDGIIEGIEMPSRTFVVGVQWHPESMLKTAPNMKQLFHALIRYSK